MDGFLVVMPKGVTLEECLTGDEAEYEEVAERILSAYKNLHKTLFLQRSKSRCGWKQPAQKTLH